MALQVLFLAAHTASNTPQHTITTMKKYIITAIAILCIALPAWAVSNGNTEIDSFNKAKRLLEQKVYYDHRRTIYCGATFDEKKNVVIPPGFHTDKHVKRCGRIEWEHVVPAENFGRTFAEWREGNPQCVDNKGKAFKGRNCASKVNMEYRHMQSDMYNLYPAIGCVNAERSNFNFTMLPSASPSFGSCPMKIEGNKVEPPENARGRISRTYKYMQWAYPRYKMSNAQNKLMEAWDKMYPVTKWECTRAKRIELIQGNSNPFVADQCAKSGL